MVLDVLLMQEEGTPMTELFDLIVIGGGRAANLAIAAGKKGSRQP